MRLAAMTCRLYTPVACVQLLGHYVGSCGYAWLKTERRLEALSISDRSLWRDDALGGLHRLTLLGSAGAGFVEDLDPKTFTLGNLFSMNLQHHAAEVASICLSAGKELTIETELKKISDVWREARFDVHNYTRGGTADRGLILKGLLPCTLADNWTPYLSHPLVIPT